MRSIIRYTLFFSILLTASCLIKPAEPEPEPWNQVEDYFSNTNIRVLHATNDQLYILSDDEFARLDQNQTLIEKRRLELPIRFYGRPAVSDHTFYQLIRNDVDSLQLNFYMTRNPEPVHTIQVDDFLLPGDTRFKGEGDARNTGVYNSLGTQFIIPVIQNPLDYYVFLLFDINLDLQNNTILSIDLAHRIDAVDFPADDNNLNNVKFIDGFYYATSLDGAIRINPVDGSYSTVFEDWILDFFKHEGKIYASKFGNELFVSETNGESFSPLNLSGNNPFSIEMVEIVNQQILSQQNVGFPFSIIQPDFSSGDLLRINSDFTQDFSAYQDIEFFNGQYYLPLFKELYVADELISEQ